MYYVYSNKLSRSHQLVGSNYCAGLLKTTQIARTPMFFSNVITLSLHSNLKQYHNGLGRKLA